MTTHKDILDYVKRWLNDNIDEGQIPESVGEDSANLLQKIKEQEELLGAKISFRQLVEQRFKDEDDDLNPEEILNHGMVAGFGGFIYYDETCEMWDIHQEEIWDLLQEESEAIGDGPIVRHLVTDDCGTTLRQFKNQMVWAAVEIIAREYVDRKEEEKAEPVAVADSAVSA